MRVGRRGPRRKTARHAPAVLHDAMPSGMMKSQYAPKKGLIVMSQTFVALSVAGPQRDQTKGTREQPLWDEHARFIEGITAGFILMGGPFEEEGGAMLIVRAEHQDDVREKLASDPWYIHGILQLHSIRRWDIYIDERT